MPFRNVRERIIAAFLMLAAVIWVSVGVGHATVVIQPNTVEHNLDAEHCFQDQDPTVCIPCISDCFKDANRVEAALDQCVVGLPAGTRDVRTSIATDIRIAASNGNEGELVPVMVNYDIWWKGNVGVWGGHGGDLRNNTYASLTLVVIDQVSGNQIYQADIHTLDVEKDSYVRALVDFGVYHDEGNSLSSFIVLLRTGRDYRIQLKLRCHSQLDYIPVPPTYYCLDYRGGSRGAGWNSLRVFAGQVASAVLAESNARVDSLSERLAHHAHSYLTGRGLGHNNTEVQTGESIFLDDDDPSPASFGAQPGDLNFPTPSVVKNAIPIAQAQTDVDGSGATDIVDVTKVIDDVYRALPDNTGEATPITHIQFTLPEASQVELRIYDSAGKLVATPLHQMQDAGAHEVTLDATIHRAGTYYYSIRAGSYFEAKKLVLKN